MRYWFFGRHHWTSFNFNSKQVEKAKGIKDLQYKNLATFQKLVESNFIEESLVDNQGKFYELGILTDIDSKLAVEKFKEKYKDLIAVQN